MLFVIGGLTTLLVLALPHPASLDVPIMISFGAAAPILGFAIYRWRHWLPTSANPWLLAGGTGIITVLTAATGDHAAMVSFSFCYGLVVLYAVLFFSPLGVAIQVILAMVGYWTTSTLYDNSDVDLLTPLEPVVTVAIIATTSAVVALLARAREASEIDPLTKVWNRRGLDRALQSALQAAGGDPRLNVAMIDIDHFKTINDQDGHAVGDEVLQQLATAWRSLLGPQDSIGRRGGDEFLVVLPKRSPAEAAAMFERLRTASPDGVTCSVGAAHWRIGDSASMLVNEADAALYLAKRRGRNCVAWGPTHTGN